MEHEYLAGHGLLGEFGRFRPVRPLTCRRGDRVVLRTARGIELGQVLAEATLRHARLLPSTPVGTLLRRASQDDERLAEQLRMRAAEFCEVAQQRVFDMGYPLIVLDAEMLLDSEHAVLHFLREDECDVRPLVSGLSRHFAVQVLLEDLSKPKQAGCGTCGQGGGGSCGSGSCGSCGSVQPAEVQAYFATLRERMMGHNRVPLL